MKYNRKYIVDIMRDSSKMEYISDIHLERRNIVPTFKQSYIKKSNILILAGDICTPLDEKEEMINNFFKQCYDKYELIIMVPGNHEYWNRYGISMEEIDRRLDYISTRYPKLFILNRNVLETRSTVFIGCTLWSDIRTSMFNGINDERYIFDESGVIDTTHLNDFHQNDKSWLENTINEYSDSKEYRKLVVITHHLPTYDLISKKYRTNFWYKYQDRYYSDLDHLIDNRINTWICGHSHSVMQIEKNGVYLGINATGYRNQILEPVLRSLD